MKTNTALKIATIFIILASLSMSGCMEKEPEYIYITEYNNTTIYVENEPPETVVNETPTHNFTTPEPAIIIQPLSTPTSSIPDDYYNISYDKHFVNSKLYNYLDGYTWNRPLVRGAGWGLPEVAELERILTNKGCNVTIRYSRVETIINHEDFENRVKSDGYLQSACLPELDQYEAWLMIELNDEMVAYNVYWSCWAFQPESSMKDRYRSNGKWHSWWYYKEDLIQTYDGSSWTAHDFIDFKDIYELEEWFLSGEAQAYGIENCEDGVWCNYVNSDEYDPMDYFLIQYGWWMGEDQYHATEKRINEATGWHTLVDYENEEEDNDKPQDFIAFKQKYDIEENDYTTFRNNHGISELDYTEFIKSYNATMIIIKN